ncbi:MAG: hypothetical protein LIO71_07825 [Ruminococcus sp.]|nr:hypothetical protein [Ruminococcus sp.]
MLMSIMVSLTGCNVWTGSVDTLLSPPKLSKQQQEIYQALTNSLDTKISLKYPKSGEYLSAFIIANFDDEPTEEAMVFYEKTGITADETSLRINILDQEDGVWKSVLDRSADGSEIETVIVSKLGESDKISIIVGYSMLQGEKQLDVYNYSRNDDESTLTENLSDTYSIMSVEDLDNDGYNELLLISSNTASSYAEAKVLKLDSNEQYKLTRVAIDSSTTDYVQCLYSNDGTSKIILIDSIIGTGTIETEILSLNSTEYRLENTSSYENVLAVSTVRPSGYTSCDIDNDGIVEIPTLTTFTGYENLPDTEQIKMTNWLTYQNKSLVVKYCGYYSINDAYFFALPERWKDNVTIKMDNNKNDVVFYEYNNSLEDSTTELLRLTVSNEEDSELIQNNGYQLMHVNNGSYYFAKISKNVDSDLEISLTEVLFNLKFCS